MKTWAVWTWLALVAVICLEIAAELCIEKSVHTSAYWLVGAVLLYILIPFLFAFVLRNTDSLVVANTLWQVGNIVGIGLIGYFVTREKLSGWNWLGVFLAALAALCMLSKKEES